MSARPHAAAPSLSWTAMWQAPPRAREPTAGPLSPSPPRACPERGPRPRRFFPRTGAEAARLRRCQTTSPPRIFLAPRRRELPSEHRRPSAAPHRVARHRSSSPSSSPASPAGKPRFTRRPDLDLRVHPINTTSIVLKTFPSTRNNMASYSITVQAIVDAHSVFIDICIGWPGGLPDAAVLKRSMLHARYELGQFGDKFRLASGASYPLMDWMIMPYRHQNLTWMQHCFNERVTSAHAVARGAIQRLKARWQCLQRRTELKFPDITYMIGACCVLHNFCEHSGEKLDTDLHSEPSREEDDVVDAAKERNRIAHELLSDSLGIIK
ncbi:protein ALP1-like [Triticum dicoccoides]|uniref:protein ALP1-like n=1 Tax=Triticum dicoccoides TaxID=85692 RepID=UPI00188EA7AF|nr:protein ALP1-like [Triticum dicoccoides]